MESPANVSLDRATVLRAVRRALGDDGAEIGGWSVERIDYPAINPYSGGLFRVRGSARAAGTVTWSLVSLVLKIVRCPTGVLPGAGQDPGPWREVFAYRSGLLADLPGVRAPRCYGVDERPGATALLWLEDVPDVYGDAWTAEQYGRAARHLGRFNGAYLTAGPNRPLPDHPWLVRDFLRRWLRGWGGVVAAARDADRRDPALSLLLPDAEVTRLLGLWESRELLLEALARQPQTLCHLDAARLNLRACPAAGGQIETVAFDWASMGLAAAGEELGLLVTSPFFRLELPIAQLEGLEVLVLAEYLAGLEDAGWHGDRRAVRFAYLAACALRTFLTAADLLLRPDPARFAVEERRWGRPIKEILEQRTALTRFVLDRGEEALSVLPEG